MNTNWTDSDEVPRPKGRGIIAEFFQSRPSFALRATEWFSSPSSPQQAVGYSAKENKIISKVRIFASEFPQLPVTFVDKFKSWKTEARERYFKFVLPLIGHRDIGKGMAVLGAMWLTGDKNTPEFLRETDRILKGKPIRITKPLSQGILRGLLRNTIIKFGEEIFNKSFAPEIKSEGSETLNEIVRQYALDEFSVFTSGGESHIDFIKDEVFLPNQLTEKQFILGLDIQVAMK